MAHRNPRLTVGFRVRFSDDGRLLVCVGRNVAVFDYPALNLIWRSPALSNPSEADISPDNRFLVVKNTSGRIRLFELPAGTLLHDWKGQKEGEGSEILFSPDGTQLLDGSWDGVLTVRNVTDGAICRRDVFPGEMITRVSCDRVRTTWAIQHQPKVCAPDARPSPSYATIHKWPFTGGDKLRLDLSSGLRSATLSPDAQRLVCLSEPQLTPMILSVRSGQILATGCPLEIGGTGHEVGWSSDGRYLACVSNDGFVFYEADDLTVVGHASAHYPSAVAFHADGVVVLGTWSDSKVIRLESVLNNHTG